jgi:hypothetical protein
VLILAAFGGLVVLLGLIFEYGEIAEYSSARELRRYKLKKNVGEILVIAGVAFETIIAVALAGKDIWGETQTAKHINEQDPLNLPIFSMYAKGGIMFSEQFQSPKRGENIMNCDASLYMQTWNTNLSAVWLHSAMGTEGIGAGGFGWYEFNFRIVKEQYIGLLSESGLRNGRMLADTLHEAQFNISRCPLTNGAIARGSIVVYVNDKAVKLFGFGEASLVKGMATLTNIDSRDLAR